MIFTKTPNRSTKMATLSLIASSVLLATSPVVSAEEHTQTLTTYSEISTHGKKVFEQYGIDHDLPKLALSSLMQGDHLVEHAYRKVTIGEDVQESSVYLIKNTDTKGNIDLHIKYDPSHLDKHENVIDQIETLTRNEYRLRNYAEAYDSSSVEAKDDGKGNVEISFNYSKYGLPQDIAYFRFLTVKIFLVDGEPKNMLITNKKPFNFDGNDIESYKQELTFSTLESGKVIIETKHTQLLGKHKKKPLEIITKIEPVAFYDEGVDVQIMNEEKLKEVSDPRMREESVKLNRVFPLMGDMVRRQGIDLPLPFGVSVAYRNQEMNIPFNDFTIQGVRLNDLFDPEDTVGVVSAESMNIRGDINILPFWNVFGYVGKIDVKANIDAGYTGAAGEYLQDKLNNKFPGLGDEFCSGGLSAVCNRGRLNVPLHLEYDLRGVGTTLSIGYKEFFASVTGTYSQTRIKGGQDWGDGIVTVQPMLGYQLVDYRAQIFVGAEYQGLDARMDGHVIAGDVEFDYDIGVDLNQWAYLIGFNKQIGKNYNITGLYNTGETRSAFTINFGYRF
ncbi:hypothetical protein [Vibrio aestuarianus]|uniref:hypothetical protein n=1 Tax=Vibrio aestuarianus TaxID=28171 RepID=UPI00237CE5B1|nr:hypothetical protein [Vibrio aestuarianus]MDE1263652.1 hypothetical protein [Vibrio aestuarianus]MDE1295580.1 hypothetical protein [Vibrio aestuarianus]